MTSELCDDMSGFTDEERVVIQSALAKLKEIDVVVNGKKNGEDQKQKCQLADNFCRRKTDAQHAEKGDPHLLVFCAECI